LKNKETAEAKKASYVYVIENRELVGNMNQA
jgi:hypothetical protein